MSTLSRISLFSFITLGLAQGEGGVLWVADAFDGLFEVQADGALQKVVSQVSDQGQSTPVLYANGVTMASGKVYFTDSTQRFGARAFNSTYKASLADILEHGGTGRLLEYDPASRAVSGWALPLRVCPSWTISRTSLSCARW